MPAFTSIKITRVLSSKRYTMIVWANLIFHTLIWNTLKINNFTYRIINSTYQTHLQIKNILFSCKSEYLNRQISSKVAVRDDVVGMLSSDWSKGVEPSIGSPTSFFIPTISYIYSEDTFLDQVLASVCSFHFHLYKYL